MPGNLPTMSGVTTSYNGYTFDPQYTRTTEFQVRPVPDRSGRTVSHVEYTIGLQSWLIGVTPSDGAVQDILCKLKAYGGAFFYMGRGVGNLAINSFSNKDVLFGPKPDRVSCKLMTGTALGTVATKLACVLDWRVTLHVAPCCEGVQFGLYPMELTWASTYRVLPTGRNEVTTTGELRIANNRVVPGSPEVMFSPDDYWELIPTPVPRNFRREWLPRVLSEDRTSLKFGWTDREMAGEVLPEGTTDARFGQSTSSGQAGLAVWATTLSGEYDIAPGYDATAGLKAFFAMVKDRIDKDRAKEANGGKDVTFVPLAFRINEPDLHHNKRVELSLTYKLAGALIDKIKPASGMFRPAPTLGGDRWDAWKESVATSALSPTGWLNLRFQVGDDRINDACSAAAPPPLQTLDNPEMVSSLFSPPAKETAWLLFRNHVRIETNPGTVRSRPLPSKELKAPELKSVLEVEIGPPRTLPSAGKPEPPSDLKTLEEFEKLDADANSGFAVLGGSVPETSTSSSSTTPDDACKVQRRAIPVHTIVMYGWALRAGYDIPVPQLTAVDDGAGGTLTPVRATDDDEGGFSSGIVWNAGVPIWGARWELKWYVEKNPKTAVVAPRNPMEELHLPDDGTEVDAPDDA